MFTQMRNWILAGLVGLLVACSGGGGGDSAAGVDPGPPPPGGPVEPPPPEFPNPSPYAKAEELVATITSAALNDSDQAVVKFQLTDGRGIAITDLADSNVRFVIARLQDSDLGNLTGSWQSYVNRIEDPGVGPGAESKLQAYYESTSSDFGFGEFVNHGDGTYTYTFLTSLTNLDQDMVDQATTEGLKLVFEANSTHRVAIQFDGSQSTANPIYDWEPATGATAVFNMDIAATANCNRCHDPLGIHGGNRREVQYCVVCHNPGSTDANSGNTVDLKVMVHKIHMGQNLPSVMADDEYAIWGFRDSKHDYSGLAYPQDIRNCVNCHVGTSTIGDRDDLEQTAQGDNWAEVPSRAACGSCHDDVAWEDHAGGQSDDLGCGQCHGPTEKFNVQYSHRMEVMQAREALEATVEQVDNSMPGQNPTVTFRISNPLTGEDYDIHNDPVFTDADARLAVGIAWDTGDYTNTGNFDADTPADNASQVQADALADATPVGDGSYSVSMPVAIPNGNLAPGVRASGSGVATVEGHPIFDLDTNNDGTTELTSVSVGDARKFFSIDEEDGDPEGRRVSVTIEQCQSCHQTLVLHGDNRADNIDSCVSCHNPRNTDRRVREQGKNPDSGGSAMATDGKDEESLDFKTMIHGIHAPSKRENALQVVGFMAFSVHVYDEEHVHYPGNLANCTACHTDEGFMLPLAGGVLGTTVDTGSDRNDPADDTVVTPVTAVCASCHDSALARTHMVEDGNGSFDTTQADIDNENVVETCEICHSEGRANDAWESHQRFLE